MHDRVMSDEITNPLQILFMLLLLVQVSTPSPHACARNTCVRACMRTHMSVQSSAKMLVGAVLFSSVVYSSVKVAGVVVVAVVAKSRHLNYIRRCGVDGSCLLSFGTSTAPSSC